MQSYLTPLQYTPDVLPNVGGGFTSRPLLFMVDGRRYAGHYHMNGFFYVADYDNYETPVYYAKHPKTKILSTSSDVPNISSWEYI